MVTKRQSNKVKSVERKGGKCQICGYADCITALEFHHIFPKKKKFSISKSKSKSWRQIAHEVDKCLLLCANCHREIHETYNIK